MFTKSRHLSLSWAILIRFTPFRCISTRCILPLSSFLRFGLPQGLFQPFSPTKPCKHPPPHTHTHTSTVTKFSLITRIMSGLGNKLRSSSLYSALLLLGPFCAQKHVSSSASFSWALSAYNIPLMSVANVYNNSNCSWSCSFDFSPSLVSLTLPSGALQNKASDSDPLQILTKITTDYVHIYSTLIDKLIIIQSQKSISLSR